MGRILVRMKWSGQLVPEVGERLGLRGVDEVEHERSVGKAADDTLSAGDGAAQVRHDFEGDGVADARVRGV